MVENVTGGCLCGTVRYVCDTTPGAAAYCHCSDCRRCTGNAFNISLPVAAAAFHFTAGAPKGYTSQADSGQALTRHFCGDCGSPIYTSSAAHPDRLYLKAGSLDDPTLVEPAYQAWRASMVAWAVIDPGLTAYDKEPRR